jgi:hypothetical protein
MFGKRKKRPPKTGDIAYFGGDKYVLCMIATESLGDPFSVSTAFPKFPSDMMTLRYMRYDLWKNAQRLP